MADTVKAVVTGVDTYRWVDEDGAIQEADRGAEIEVSAKEFARAQTMQPAGLDKAGSDAAKAAASPPPAGAAVAGPGPLPDDLLKLSDKELKALAEQRSLYVGDDVTRDELLAAIVDAPGSQQPNP